MRERQLRRPQLCLLGLLAIAVYLALGIVQAYASPSSTTRGHCYDARSQHAQTCTRPIPSESSPTASESSSSPARPRPTRVLVVRAGVATKAMPVGGPGVPRFVAASDGMIDTASPVLRQQIDDVADSMITTGSPPPGVRQGGLPGKPGVYGNKSGALPDQPVGYYHEADVWPGTGPRGTERIVVGNSGEVWYTPNHYGTLRPLR